MLNIDISDFLQQEKLPSSYGSLINKWFCPLAEAIVSHQFSAKKPIIVGINGAQGSGKSTLAACLVYLLTRQFGLRAVSLSIDDFYFTRSERQRLADAIHPLLMTRGVPGTHDVVLARKTLSQLINGHFPVAIPRFNKAVDDRFPESEFTSISEPVDVIVFEGWCVGSTASEDADLALPCNDLEAEEDTDGVWRRYVNTQLARFYPKLFELIDYSIMLKAPSFECVYHWRLEQEDKLRAVATEQTHVMSEPEVARFIKFYQRITENTLMTLPNTVNTLYELDDKRTIINMRSRPAKQENRSEQWLIFTDMDGSLLDHHDYNYDAAIPTLNALAAVSIPVIPVTSKTQAEVERIRESLDNHHPFIIENGAAVYIPVGYFEQQPEDTVEKEGYWVKAFTQGRKYWQDLIDTHRPQYQEQFSTFADVGIDGIMALTGLNVHEAALSARRQFGEPISWHGSHQTKQAFISDLEQAGANILIGGRFMHVSGECDKGRALTWLKQVYQAAQPEQRMISLAIGDSQNDQAMLEVADRALLIRSPVHNLPAIDREEHLLISTHTGPKGWAEGVNKLIDATLHSDSSNLPRGNHG